MEKPLIFISHSSKDKDYALVLEEHIHRALENVDTFVSSNPAAIDSGEDWVGKVLSQLDNSHLLVIVMTHNALESNWVIFELGFSWKKLDSEMIHFILYPGVEPPSPLSMYQGKSMTEVDQLQSFFQAVASDLNREYVPNMYELRNLAESAFEHIPRIVQNREFDAWKYHLRNSKWAEEELSLLDESKTASTCERDMTFQIVHYVEEFKRAKFGPWSEGFPDPTSYVCTVDLNIAGATVKRLWFAHLDGLRLLVPVPKLRTVQSDADSSYAREYFYDENSLDFLVGKVIGRFESAGGLEEFAFQRSILIIATSN